MKSNLIKSQAYGSQLVAYNRIISYLTYDSLNVVVTAVVDTVVVVTAVVDTVVVVTAVVDTVVVVIVKFDDVLSEAI